MHKAMAQLSSLLLLIMALLTACSASKVKDNELTQTEIEEGWKLLFDGQTLNGWHLYNKGKIPSAWAVMRGALYCDPSHPEQGDLLTDQEYKNFEFKFEWKLTAGGNSGVFINVQERDTLETAWASGPEYQLLDKSHYDYEMLDKRSGCLYGFASQKNPVEARGNNEWNQSTIKQFDGKIEFYLNGVLTAQQDLTTEEWREKVASTNFKNFPEFGKYTSGRIALQDWNKGVSFRNLKIKEL